FSLQKRLKGLGLSTAGATFSRFLFAVPLAGAGVLALAHVSGHDLFLPGPLFWAFAISAGIAQIIATFCTVALFSERSFAVGIAFTKTETIQVALFSAILLGESVSAAGAVAICIGFAGVVLLSRPAGGWRQGGIFNRATVLGLLAGGFFGLSAIGYRGATLEIDNPDALFRAAFALACVTAFQTLAMVIWLTLREPGETGRVLRAWRATLPVGVTGVLGSYGWFIAFALQNAAYVRAVGQVELVFSILASMLFFGERPHRREVLGMALLGFSILLIVLFR
ncbi:MAG: DMT family transporter, partial [Pseudorhodobacter sp.]